MSAQPNNPCRVCAVRALFDDGPCEVHSGRTAFRAGLPTHRPQIGTGATLADWSWKAPKRKRGRPAKARAAA